MRRRHGKVNRWVLVVVAALALGLFAVQSRSARNVRTRLHAEKLEAAKLSRDAFALVKKMRESLGLPTDTVNDPNQTGLVGLQYSPLTYGRSDLSDALTTLNPNFSAAVVELLVGCGVRRGERIGVSWDGTYPALNIGVLAAAQALELEPVIVTAQSAGMWGADNPGMTWLDIERMLFEADVFRFRTRYATLGGESDDGRGLSPEGREILAAAAEGVDLVIPDSLAAGVKLRLDAFDGVRAMVSVGRVVADLGGPTAQAPSRILRNVPAKLGTSGTIAAMLRKRVPVIHISNPSRVALDHGLPVAPEPVPEPGRGRLFFERRYPVWMAAAFCLVLALAVFVVVRYDIESSLARRPKPEQEAV